MLLPEKVKITKVELLEGENDLLLSTPSLLVLIAWRIFPDSLFMIAVTSLFFTFQYLYLNSSSVRQSISDYLVASLFAIWFAVVFYSILFIFANDTRETKIIFNRLSYTASLQSKEIFYTLSLEFDLRRINNLVLIEKPIGVVIEFADGDEILEYELYFRTTADRDKLLNFLASVIERTVDDREYNQG